MQLPTPFGGFARTRVRGGQRIDLAEVRKLLERGRFSTEYQPLIHTRTGRTVGYEALARFRSESGKQILPTRVLPLLHADPALFLRAELTLKLHQIEHSPRAPLFLNLDPDAWDRAGDRDRNPFLALFASAPVKIVVEVTEALAQMDAARTQSMIASLRARRISVALDDVGAAQAILTFDALCDAEVIKFDRTLIPRLRHPRCRAFVMALARMTRETGGHTVLEGIETTSDFVLARDLGIDLVQGFLFKDRIRVAAAEHDSANL